MNKITEYRGQAKLIKMSELLKRLTHA